MEMLTVDELVGAANDVLKQSGGTFQAFTPRTVYFYTRKGILPAIRGRRQARRYPAEWVYRLVLTRRLQVTLPQAARRRIEGLMGEDPTLLPGIARVLERLSEERIRILALGRDPLDGLPEVLGPISGRAASPVKRAPLAYDPVEAQFGSLVHELAPTTAGEDWETVHAGPRVEVRVRSGGLDEEARETLEAAARLMERALQRPAP